MTKLATLALLLLAGLLLTEAALYDRKRGFKVCRRACCNRATALAEGRTDVA